MIDKDILNIEELNGFLTCVSDIFNKLVRNPNVFMIPQSDNAEVHGSWDVEGLTDEEYSKREQEESLKVKEAYRIWNQLMSAYDFRDMSNLCDSIVLNKIETIRIKHAIEKSPFLKDMIIAFLEDVGNYIYLHHLDDYVMHYVGHYMHNADNYDEVIRKSNELGFTQFLECLEKNYAKIVEILRQTISTSFRTLPSKETSEILNNIQPEPENRLKDSDCIKMAILATYNKYKLLKKEFSLFYLVTKGVIDKHCTQEQMQGYIKESGIPSDKLPSISSMKALTTNKDYPNWNIQGISINDKERCNEIGKFFYEEFKRLKN